MKTRIGRKNLSLAAAIIFWLACGCLGAPAIAGPISCPATVQANVQETEQPKQQPDDPKLPEHAIWRIGEFGKSTNANGIYRIAYSPDGNFMATRDQANVVVVYDVKTRKSICKVEPHEERVLTIDFSPDGRYFMTAAGPNEKVKIWETATANLADEIDTDATAAYFNKEGSEINVLGERYVERYSWPGAQMNDQSKWKKGNEKRVGMSRDGRFVVGYKHLHRQTYETFVIDLESKPPVTLSGTNTLLKSAKFSPDNNWLAATYQANFRVYLWDLRSETKKGYTLSKHKSTAQSISFSSDSRFLVSSGWDKKVVAWDLATRQAIAEFPGHTDNVNATAFAPFGFTFATGASGTTDCSAIVWNMKSILFNPEHKPDPNTTLSVEKQFEKIWRSLGVSSFRLSMKSTSMFVQSGDLYLDAFEEMISPSIKTRSSGSIEKSIALLSHPEYLQRERAHEFLVKNRQKAEAILRRELRETTSLETKFRISIILKQKVPRRRSNFLETRRWHRSMFALEEINSKRSQEILLQIADGHVDSELAQLAQACYDRNVARAKLASESEE